MPEHCEHCGDLTDDLMAHKMNHALDEGLEMPSRGFGSWNDDGSWRPNSRNWSEPPDDAGD